MVGMNGVPWGDKPKAPVGVPGSDVLGVTLADIKRQLDRIEKKLGAERLEETSDPF